MPAASEDPAPLPHTFRPIGVRVAAAALGLLLLTTVTVIWLAFPQEVRDQFSWLQRATLILFGVVIGACGHALARSRVVARADGLTVVNGYRVRRYDWNQILGVSLRAGAPWALLDLSDGTTANAMGIQGSDGARAMEQIKLLRKLVAQQSDTDRDD